MRNTNRKLTGVLLAASTAIGARAFAAVPETPQGVLPAAGAAQDSKALQFKIAAGPLDEGIAEFKRITGLKVVLTNPRIGEVQSAGASGSMTPEHAMDTMLAGTGVGANFSSDTVTLEVKALQEFIAVIGDPIKLSSPKFTQPLRDTPATIVVIPQQVYQQQNATSLRDVLRNTPGITMSIGEGGSGGTSSGDNILVRGFSARNDIYVDGARDPGLVSRDAFNIQSVEVAKGPSSATGGRGTTGGSINLVTKTPEDFNGGSVRVIGGNANYKRSTVDLNQKLTSSVALRFNGLWQDTGYPGRDVAKYKSWGAAPSLAIGLGKPTQLTLSYSRYQQDNIPDWGLPTLLPDVAIAKGVTINDIKFSNFYGFVSRDYETTKSDLGTVTLQHKFNDTFSVRNLSRYGKNYRDAVLTPPRPATSVAGQGPTDPGYDPNVAQIRRTDTKYQHRNDRVAANQTDFVIDDLKTGPIVHDADIGFEVSRDHQPTYAFTDTFANGRPPVDDLFNPTPYDVYKPALAPTGAKTDAHARGVAVYAFDAINLSKQWIVDFGARWDHIVVDYRNLAATGVATNFGRTDSAVSGRAGLLFKPTTESSIYASYSTSFYPTFDGTLGLTLAATGVNSQALEPERTHNVEIGTKWDLARSLNVSLAVFDMEKTNAKTTDLSGATVLAGDQDVKGVELDLSGNITPEWGVFGGLALMHGEVKESRITSEVGAQLPYVPKASLSLWSSYRFGRGFTINGGANYSSGNYFNQTGTFLFVAGGTTPNPKYAQNAAAVQALTKYWAFNLGATYQLTEHVQLQVNGTNLGNAKYADRAYDRHFLPGPTRQVLIGPVIIW